MDKKFKNSNFAAALKNSVNGIKQVYKNERNIKIQTFFALIALILSIALKLSAIEFAIIITAIFIVLISEFFNTAIENTVDIKTEEYDNNAKCAKDIAAAAVTLSAILSLIIGIIIFLPKIIKIIGV